MWVAGCAVHLGHMRFLLLACRAHALAPTSQQHQLQYSRDGQGSYPRRSSGSRFQIYVLPISNRPALSASGTDPRRRYSIKMQRSWKKKSRGILEMTPPLRGGDFQGIVTGRRSDALLDS